MPKISLFQTIRQTENGSTIELDDFLEQVRTGYWQDAVTAVRLIKDKAERNKAKQELPYVTISGMFTKRENSSLYSASGFMAVDVDEQNPAEIKALLKDDPFVYAVFMSCSGRGACILIRYNPMRHTDAFNGIQEYLYNVHNIVIDNNCKDVSRPRYVSYDPDLLHRGACKIFSKYIRKQKQPEYFKYDVVFIQGEFDALVEDLEAQLIDITGNYQDWLRIGFALVSKFSEAGRQYYHRISAVSPVYTKENTDRQYDACLRSNGKGITVSTIYWLCKQHGMNIASDTVKAAIKKAKEQKDAKIPLEAALANLDGIHKDITEQVYQTNVFSDEASQVEAARLWVMNQNLQRNLITGLIESNGTPITDTQQNSIELRLKEQMPKIDYASITRVMDSDAIPSYHPIFDYLRANEHRKTTGHIAELFDCIDTPTGEGSDYILRMGTKWLVGMIANLYAQPKLDYSPLMLVLCGEKMGIGKSYFFEHFLPMELRRYTAKKDLSVLSSDTGTSRRDLEIAVTRYWLIYDDEMGGKSKRDHKAINSMLSTDSVTNRASYGRHDQYRKRIAIFGGTTNDLDIIADHGRQRRYIPIEVNWIDHARKDSLNPSDYLMEAYHLYHGGYDYRVLGEDITILNEHTEGLTYRTPAYNWIQRLFRKPNDGETGAYYTSTDIGSRIALHTHDRISSTQIAEALRDLGVDQERRRVNKQLNRWYCLVENYNPNQQEKI